MILTIIFNILFWITLACLIKPSLLSRYTGSDPLPRWIFLIALFLIVAIKSAIAKPDPPIQAQNVDCELGRYGHMECKQKQKTSSQQITPTAAAADLSLTDTAATP